MRGPSARLGSNSWRAAPLLIGSSRVRAPCRDRPAQPGHAVAVRDAPAGGRAGGAPCRAGPARASHPSWWGPPEPTRELHARRPAPGACTARRARQVLWIPITPFATAGKTIDDVAHGTPAASPPPRPAPPRPAPPRRPPFTLPTAPPPRPKLHGLVFPTPRFPSRAQGAARLQGVRLRDVRAAAGRELAAGPPLHARLLHHSPPPRRRRPPTFCAPTSWQATPPRLVRRTTSATTRRAGSATTPRRLPLCS